MKSLPTILVSLALGGLVELHAAVVNFAAIGDFGSAYPSTRGVANLVKSWRPDFVITLGDNISHQRH